MHILVVEDDPVLADALTHTLRGLGHAVDCMMAGTDADRALAACHYDLVVLDIGLPKMDGFQVLQRMRQRKQKTPVLILTARESVYDRIYGLDLGADDYLTKPFAMGELEARIRALARRARGATDDQIRIGQLVIDLGSRRALLNGVFLDLTARELALLEALSSRAGRVVSKDALIDSLYELDREVSPNAIEIHVHRLRRKLQDSDVVIRTIRGLGYLLEPRRAGRQQSRDES
ncbi:MAG TPA: response regulator transcription factor [Burkholderiales bacterium]|nr:response regulator transcription factor [Burkholderiales bacterium]